MDITIEEKGSCQKLVKVKVPYEEFKVDVDDIKRAVQQSASVPGFRSGKAPWFLIEQQYGDTIDSEIKNRVIQNAYQKVLTDKGLHPAVSPVVKNIEYKKQETLDFEMDIETIPVIDLPKYKGIKVNKRRHDVKEEDVEKQLFSLQERQAQFSVVDQRPAEEGDYAVVDYVITQKDEVLDQAKQVWVELKKDFFIKDFCQNIIGMRCGEEKDIKVLLPKEYPKPALSGKKVVIKVKLNEIKQKQLPQLNDDFARSVGEYDSLAELKDRIRLELDNFHKGNIQKEMLSQIEEYLTSKSNFDLPPTIMDNAHNAVYNDTVNWLKNTGKADENIIKEKDAELKDSTHKEAKDRLKLIYILESIAEKEGIEISDSDVNARLSLMAEKSGKKLEEVKAYIEKEKNTLDFKYKLKNEKVMDFLMQNAVIQEVDASKDKK